MVFPQIVQSAPIMKKMGVIISKVYPNYNAFDATEQNDTIVYLNKPNCLITKSAMNLKCKTLITNGAIHHWRLAIYRCHCSTADLHSSYKNHTNNPTHI
jgi:hypothetical protein